jgi:hypothetical protein
MSFTKKLGARPTNIAKPRFKMPLRHEGHGGGGGGGGDGDGDGSGGEDDHTPRTTPVPQDKPCDPVNTACGYVDKYLVDVVQEFSVIFTNWKKFLQMTRALAGTCPLVDTTDVNIPALDLEILCRGKWLVNFYVGSTLGRSDADRGDGNLAVQSDEDINKTTEVLDALAGDDFQYSTQQLVIVDTDVDVSGVYAQLFERLYDQGFDILGVYTDETGYIVSLRVLPQFNVKLQRILRATREELRSGKVGCYECPTLPSLLDLSDDKNCESAILNCSWKYPCKCEGKDRCEKKDKCKYQTSKRNLRQDDDEDSADEEERETVSIKSKRSLSRMTFDNLQCGCHNKKH